jgi:DeoR family ulaG and ulaABCDEF operon transcriptional repressor
MLADQRRAAILRILSLRELASIHEVVAATGASEATIRRDFTDLERNGKLIRVRGGVRLAGSEQSTAPEWGKLVRSDFGRRMEQRAEKKRRIAQRASLLIEHGETVFIDGGTTTFFLAEYLAERSVHVITNSFAIADHLLQHSSCTVTVPEGTVDPETLLILNTLSSDPFANYAASKAIMGAEGITESVVTNKDTLLIQTERAMISHAKEVIIVADESKFGTLGHLTLCPVETASVIITTNDADPHVRSMLEAKGVRVLVV